MEFFIAGSQRSGTTLMRLITDSHPQIWCCGETTAYKLLENNQKPITNKQHIGYQVPIWTELFVEYDCIKNKIQGRKFIFMIRDVLDVVSSMKSMGGDWLKNEIIGNINLWLTDRARGVKSYKDYLIDDTSYCAVYWMYKTEHFLKMVEKGYDVIGIKYENLVSHPRRELMGLCDFLGVEWSENMMNHHKICHTEGNGNEFMGGSRGDRAIDKKSMHSWRNRLTSDEIDKVLNITGDFSKRLL
jgi:hypothetical protein